MASASRFASVISIRSVCARRANAITRTLIAKPLPVSAVSPPTNPLATMRFASVLGTLETMLPLHSTIAAARLRSNIAVGTSCWSWLSQDFAIPR